MSKQSTSFEIGFALGSVVREFRRALSRPPVVVQAPVASSVQRIEPAMLAGPTAKEPGTHQRRPGDRPVEESQPQ